MSFNIIIINNFEDDNIPQLIREDGRNDLGSIP